MLGDCSYLSFNRRLNGSSYLPGKSRQAYCSHCVLPYQKKRLPTYLDMEKDTYYVWGYPLFARETCICNEGNPLFARESCICNEGNPLFARESKGSPPTRFKNNIVYYSQAHFFNSFYTYRFKLKAIYLSIHLSIMNLHKEVLAPQKGSCHFIVLV